MSRFHVPAVSVSIYYYYLLLLFFTPVFNSQGMKKLRYATQKSTKNQAGINLTPPLPPSQNSHAVRWHCTAELLLLICTRRMLTAEYTKIVRLQTVRLSKNVFNSKTSVAAANRQHQVGLI